MLVSHKQFRFLNELVCNVPLSKPTTPPQFSVLKRYVNIERFLLTSSRLPQCSWPWLMTVLNPVYTTQPVWRPVVSCINGILWWTRMWANAQPDGPPAEHRWRPLFNAAKFGWRPCRAVTLPTRETRWNLQGCLKLPDGSQPLVGRSSPYCAYCEDMWRTYRCLRSFFPIVDMCLSFEDIARQSCAMVPRWRFLATFFASCISSEPRAAGFRPAS